jgi:hypothetical protein
MLVKLCLIAASLPLLGFLRSSIDGKKPDYLLKVQTVVKKWHDDNGWAARFSPFFSLFIFLYNFFVWGVYGFTSIFEFVGFVIQKIWWLILWVWNEVLHPTVFALVKYLWHYLVVFSWKFFAFAFSKIPGAFQKEKMLFAFKKLLLLGGVSGLLGLACLLTGHIVVIVVSALIVFYLFQYTVFVTISYCRTDKFPEISVFPGLKLSVLWLAMSAMSTAILVALSQFADVYIVAGLSVLLIQVLLPFAVLFGLAFLATTLYLPAYMSEAGDDVDILQFLKALLFRAPKLIVSQSFQQIGIAILSVIPAVVFLLLNTGIKQVTGKDLPGWGKHVVQIEYHIPAITENYKNSKQLDTESVTLQQSRDSLEEVFSRQIGVARNQLAEAVDLKNKIEDRKIHTIERNAYVGENQGFSMPEIPGCTQYEWVVTNVATKRELKRVSVSTAQKPGSLVMSQKWTTPGKYNISIRTKAPCNDGVDQSISVDVVSLPENFTLNDLPEDRYFVSREAADYAIDLINKQIQENQLSKKEQLDKLNKEIGILTDRVDYLQFSTKEHIEMLISKILAYFGLVLLLVLYLSAIWTYWVTYHYDMFNFEQEGKHYWVRQLEEMRAKNPNQPLLGIFVLIIFISVVFALMRSYDFICHLF